MKYPKKVMRLKELEKMGFPQDFLLRAYRTRGQNFAQKQNPSARNSPILFDTELFEEWRLKQLMAENKALPRGRAAIG